MAFGLRSTVSELVIYDADDQGISDGAAEYLDSHKYGAWTVASEGIHKAAEISGVLERYENIEQLTFNTHGSPGRVHFKGGDLSGSNLDDIVVPPNLFRHAGRLLFMGCEIARTTTGEGFLIAAGRRFFGAKGGVVGGATVWVYGEILPLIGVSSAGNAIGRLVLFRLDGRGEVIADMSVKPIGIAI